MCKSVFAGGDKPLDFSLTQDELHKIPIFANGVENDGLVGFTSEAKVFDKAITISGRGTLGFASIRNEPFVPIVRLIVAIPDDKKVNIKYFKYAIDKLEIKNTGGTIPQLTVPNFSTYEIPVPPLSEQEKIVSEIEEYEKEIARLREMMDSCASRKKAVLERFLS